MGSTRVLQVAMGRTEADEYKANLSQLTERVRGSVGLFFTKLPRHEARQGAWAHSTAAACCSSLAAYGQPASAWLLSGNGRPVINTVLMQYHADFCHKSA